MQRPEKLGILTAKLPASLLLRAVDDLRDGRAGRCWAQSAESVRAQSRAIRRDFVAVNDLSERIGERSHIG
jgi:hypothetical protein